MNHICKILPRRIFKRGYCKDDLSMGFGEAQLFTHESGSRGLLWQLQSFPEQCCGSWWWIWKGVIKNK